MCDYLNCNFKNSQNCKHNMIHTSSWICEFVAFGEKIKNEPDKYHLVEDAILWTTSDYCPFWAPFEKE